MSITDKFKKVLDNKNSVRDAINAKGGTVDDNFSTYGDAILALVGNIETGLATLVDVVVSNAKTLGFNFTTGGNFMGCSITVYDGTDASGTVLYSGTIEYGSPPAINNVVVDIPNEDFYLVLSTGFYFDGGGNFIATNVDNFTANPATPSWATRIIMSGKVTGEAIISGSIVMDS